MRPSPTVLGALLGAALLLATAPSAAQEAPRFVRLADVQAIDNGARSLAIGDYDNDGYPDLLLAATGVDGRDIGCLRNLGGAGFARESATAFPLSQTREDYGGGAIFGDYDNDGDLDVYVPVGSWYLPRADYLLRNDRGTFTDVTAASGIHEIVPSDNAIWLDYDRDGLLDLYVGHLDSASPARGDTIIDPAVRNTLYRNQGDGTFRDVTASAGLLVPFHPQVGGSNGGMISADLDDDGWPDLFVSVFGASKRLFLNDRHGGFTEATTADMQDDSEAYGVAAADVDNDGRLDLFAPGGGSGRGNYRSLLLLNLGRGIYTDALEALGLGTLSARQVLGTGMADLDNDGDQDLLVGEVAHWWLFLNRGDGTFAERIGTVSCGTNVALGDLDLDGTMDLVGDGAIYLQQGRGGHWLVVELAGRQSNRNGIGARVRCIAGDLRQTQQVLGGRGYVEDELVARFGLGAREQADSLEVRWPSGQVDRLGPLAADQRVRVFEGGPVRLQIEPTRWVSVSPETLRAGSTLELTAVVRPALYEPGGQITAAMADLRGLGGSSAVPLELSDDGTCRLKARIPVSAVNCRLTFPVLVEQSSSLGPYWIRTFSPALTIMPAGDLSIYADALDPQWSIRTVGIDTTHRTSSVAWEGQVSWNLTATSPNWQVTLKPASPIEPTGYQALHLAVLPAEGTLTRLSIILGASFVTVWPVQPEGPVFDPSLRSWQMVEVPMASFQDKGAISSIALLGTGKGTLYLDDLRLVAVPSAPPSTAVEEAPAIILPQSPALAQNYPNPFNTSTVFRFTLPQAGKVELAVYDLLGQRLAALASGLFPAGPHAVVWDGRDGQGRPLASGVYLYRLEAEGASRVRRLALVR